MDNITDKQGKRRSAQTSNITSKIKEKKNIKDGTNSR